VTSLWQIWYNNGMAVRTTVDVPETVYEALRSRAEQTGSSMRSLIIQAIELTYLPEKKGTVVKEPPVKGKGKLGPLGEGDANVNDFLFS
jgi:hypothetical protein